MMMNALQKILSFLRGVVKTLRLALPKLGVGWMFALLTINFNRITIVEMDVAAIAVTAMLAMHYLLSPFQVISGRIADNHPIAGLRRTPYYLMAAVVASLAFLGLPSAAFAMGDGLATGFAGGFALLLIFGVAIAVMGDSHHSLIAEVVEPEKRGGVISVVWTFTILSTIIAAVIMSQVMPEFTPEAMQQLYNMTPLIVIGSALVGMVGIEPRLSKEDFEITQQQAQAATPQGNPISSAIQILKTNKQAAGFFAFVFVSILSIFLQDNILEPFGAEVFGMSVAETNSFQPTWGGGVLVGMLLMGAISTLFSIEKRTIAMIGCAGTSAGMAILAGAAFTETVEMVKPSLMLMGLFTGFFNVGALSMMMDMTIEGATGLYMGMWGMAQAFGNGTASFGGGALHTAFIDTGLFVPSAAYMVIFAIEAVGMGIAGLILWNLSVQKFHVIQKSSSAGRLQRKDAVLAMEADL